MHRHILVYTLVQVLYDLKAHFAEGEAVRCTVISCIRTSGKAHVYNVSMIGVLVVQCAPCCQFNCSWKFWAASILLSMKLFF